LEVIEMKMIEPEDLLEKLMNDEITREEFEVFLEGLDDTEIQAKYVKYLQLKFEEHLETHHTSLEEKPDFFTDHLLLHARKPEKQHVPVKARKRFHLSIAAALLILVGLTFSTLFVISQFDGNNKALEANIDAGPQILTKSTPNKRMFRMRLQDGSFVHLNAVSSISYPQKFDDKSREIEILGEAYFSVERDEKRPFNIKVKDHAVRVLGTSFSIKAYNDEEDFSVTVESGTVSVELNQDDLNACSFLPKVRDWCSTQRLKSFRWYL
jgi:transmembrane sensor